jgi:Cu+-exporting ATPase
MMAVIIIIALILTGNLFEARAKQRTSAALRALTTVRVLNSTLCFFRHSIPSMTRSNVGLPPLSTR